MTQKQGENNGMTASGDISSQKREFSSLYDIANQLIYGINRINVIVKSKSCKACEFLEKKSNIVEYEEWAEKHQNESS